MTCDNNTKTYFCLQMTSMKFFELKPMDRVRMDMTRAWYKLAQKKLLRSLDFWSLSFKNVTSIIICPWLVIKCLKKLIKF